MLHAIFLKSGIFCVVTGESQREPTLCGLTIPIDADEEMTPEEAQWGGEMCDECREALEEEQEYAEQLDGEWKREML